MVRRDLVCGLGASPGLAWHLGVTVLTPAIRNAIGGPLFSRISRAFPGRVGRHHVFTFSLSQCSSIAPDPIGLPPWRFRGLRFPRYCSVLLHEKSPAENRAHTLAPGAWRRPWRRRPALLRSGVSGHSRAHSTAGRAQGQRGSSKVQRVGAVSAAGGKASD